MVPPSTCGSDVVIGVDIGATALTVVISGEDLAPCEIVEWAVPGLTAVDPLQRPWLLLDLLISAVREATGICQVFGSRVRALSVTVGVPSLFALDRYGAPVTSVADTGDAGVARRIMAECGGELRELTGVPISPASPVAKLAWFGERHGGPGERIAQWTGLKGFLLARLTDRLVGDVSSWSADGMVDARTMDWALPVLDLIGVGSGQLPELSGPETAVPMSAWANDALGLPAGTPVVVGASRLATTHLGLGAMHSGDAALSMGSSSALSVVEHDATAGRRGDRVATHVFTDGLRVTLGSFVDGDAVTRWATESFGDADADALLAEAERVPFGSDGLLGIPHRPVDWLPSWNPDLQATLVGLRVGHGRAAMTRAMAEGVARQLATVRDDVLVAGDPVPAVRASGRTLSAPLWGSLLAAALDAPLEIVRGAVAPAFGAALMAWRGLGRLTSLTEPVAARLPARLVRPDPLATAHFAATRQVAEQLTQLFTQLRTVS